MTAWGERIPRSVIAAAGLAILVGSGTADAIAICETDCTCVGDCDGNGSVAINELVTLVNIALGAADASVCPGAHCDGDTVDVACIISAVHPALTGCPVIPTTAGIVFNGEDNRLSAYLPGPGFPKQTVIPSGADLPGGTGRDLNAQICFTRGPQGQVRFIGGEDTNQGGGHNTAGWGFFELTGTEVGQFQFEELGKLIPSYQTTADGAENYGCGFLSDGRLLTTDVGNQSAGDPNGQLIIWFPPFDTGVTYTATGVIPNTPIHHCKLDIGIGTAQQIAIDGQDRIYVASARPGGDPGPGIYRYTGPFPTSDTPQGGCDGTDDTGAPMATSITKERFIPNDGNLVTPTGIAIKPDGNFYISSVITGIIAEYDAQGLFVRRVLQPSAPGFPIPTGSPLGIVLASDGTIYFADIGLVADPVHGIGPGNHTGTVRRIRFVDGQPQPPEIMDSGLDFPDGIGILELPTPTSTSGSGGG